MAYVVIIEMLPDALKDGAVHFVVLSFVIGAAVALGLKILLGL